MTSTQQSFIQGSVVRVAVPLAIPMHLDYAWSSSTPATVGAIVEVKVASKTCHGVVTEVLNESPYKKLKPAILINNLSAEPVKFYKWVASYTLSFPGDPIRAAFIGGKIPEQPEPTKQLVITNVIPPKLTPARKKVLDLLKATTSSESVATLAKTAEVSDAVVRGLIKLDCLKWVVAPEVEITPAIKLAKLSKHQQNSADEFSAAIHRDKFQPILLDGVMGSGKTEVYFDSIANLIQQNNNSQILVLVPEIALTPGWLKRFKIRFGFTPTVWHSGVGEAKRRKNWWQIFDGKAKVIVGARSAIFLPFANLKFIIIDEEHDSSYKQEEKFRYHGRDMAVSLASIWNCPVVLASATPSLETWNNALTGRYKHLTLPSRHGAAVLPDVRLVDMKAQAPKEKDKFISPPLNMAIERRLKKGEQSLIFLNRRGTAPLLICNACGHRVECPCCDASLVVHGGHLECHYCGFTEPRPNECPKCLVEGKLNAFGPGTRKIFQELKDRFPQARIAVADSDSITTTKQMGELVDKMESAKIDILVGTQMVAKGHHFPKLTLVGVVDSDMGLAHGELRAAEHTFQLLMQVGGRAGREDLKGEVLLQTYDPSNPLFKALVKYDRDKFFDLEMQSRKTWGDPPFGRQVAIILSGKNEFQVKQAGQQLALSFSKTNNVGKAQLLGPAVAPIAKIRDNYRYRLLVKSTKPCHNLIKNWLENTSIPTTVRLDIDVDPVSYL